MLCIVHRCRTDKAQHSKYMETMGNGVIADLFHRADVPGGTYLVSYPAPTTQKARKGLVKRVARTRPHAAYSAVQSEEVGRK